MKNPTTIILAALTLTGSAWAASPYDMPYGVQWSFLIGSAGVDNPNAVTVSPDGTIWIATDGHGNTDGSPMLAWGSPTGIYGGFFACGYGQINRNGGILQANDIPNVTGISGYNQGRNSTIAFAGNDPTAYFGTNPNATGLLWTDAIPADDGSNAAQPMTFAINSVLGEVGYAPYADYVNAPGDPEDTTLPRKNDPLDATKKFTHKMVGSDAYGGSVFDFTMGSDGSYYIARGSQGPGVGDPLTEGDSFTVGDFSGPAAASYKPAVGRISADGLTKTGPVHQPECGAGASSMPSISTSPPTRVRVGFTPRVSATPPAVARWTILTPTARGRWTPSPLTRLPPALGTTSLKKASPSFTTPRPGRSIRS